MNLLRYVNIKQGTKSERRFSSGNTLPLTQLPFGMAGFVPQTDGGRGNWYYHPDDRSLEGVRLTHQPSPWIGDYGALLFQPQEGEPQWHPDGRWSGYRPEEAVLRPDYQRLEFLRYRAVWELAPSERGAAIRLTYAGNSVHRLAVLPVGGSCSWRLDIKNRRLYGWNDFVSMGQAKNFRMYMVMAFDTELLADQIRLSGSEGQLAAGTAGEGKGLGIHLAFASSRVCARMAISYISEAQAERTLERELMGKTFDEVQCEAAENWEEHLSRIEVEARTEAAQQTFYSCLYRLFLYPHKAYELDENDSPVHYCPGSGTAVSGIRYTDNGFWDTYRTVYPLFSLIAQKEYAEILEGFVQDYLDNGWLPRWPSIGECGMMPGTLIDAVIAEAAVKGIGRRQVLEAALEGMLRHAREESADPRFGRTGVLAYQKHGYIPFDQAKESVNETLDSAYGDYCIAQTAAALGRLEVAREFRERAGNYRHLFDPAAGFMRGRDSQGHFRDHFDPFDWGGDYTEGSAWQNSFNVPHDVEGLAALYGGREKLLHTLDVLFAAPPRYNVAGYGTEIHEMSEMAAVDYGQCAISNQPSFSIPYLYAALGQRDKTVYWVHQMMEEVFSSEPDGFPGDEDNGTMAGWYLFSALGLYTLCPGSGKYVLGAPLVNKAKLRLSNGHVLEIEGGAETAGGITWKGRPVEEAYMEHAALTEGGRLKF